MSTHSIEHIKTLVVGDGSLELSIVPMFSDNYGYIIKDVNTNDVAVVDPADHGVMLEALQRMGNTVNVKQLWCTHKHADHAGGNEAFAIAYPGATIYGPKEETEVVPALTHQCEDGFEFGFGSHKVKVFHVPCHTRGHIVYYINTKGAEGAGARVLAAGDTLFHGGCGRFFEGTAAEMLSNMDRLRQLPDDTVVLPAHEYTLGNIAFNVSVDKSQAVKLASVKEARENGEFTVPTTIGAEKQHNLFMKTREETVQQMAAAASGDASAKGDAEKTMKLLRELKNGF